MTTPAHPRAWCVTVVTDARLARGRAHAEIVRAAIAGGADAIQFRDKEGDTRACHAAALELRAICRDAGVAFIVNDRVDLALAVAADGVHVGQRDLPARVARRLIGPARILGVSAGSVAEAVAAAAEGADYVGAGPVYEARQTKTDAAPPVGLAALAQIAAAVHVPVIAIGGIGVANAGATIRAGAAGVAVVSAAVAAPDVAAAVRALRQAVLAARATAPVFPLEG